MLGQSVWVVVEAGIGSWHDVGSCAVRSVEWNTEGCVSQTQEELTFWLMFGAPVNRHREMSPCSIRVLGSSPGFQLPADSDLGRKQVTAQLLEFLHGGMSQYGRSTRAPTVGIYRPFKE